MFIAFRIFSKAFSDVFLVCFSVGLVSVVGIRIAVNQRIQPSAVCPDLRKPSVRKRELFSQPVLLLADHVLYFTVKKAFGT
jgi:hypothetical protein